MAIDNTSLLSEPGFCQPGQGHPRLKSLANICHSVDAVSASKSVRNMEKALSTFVAKSWPNCTSLVAADTATGAVSHLHFTMTMDSESRAYVRIKEDPKELFQKAMTFFSNVRDKVKESGEAGVRIMAGTLTKDMAYAIFGSNAIERAGLGLEETLKMCEKIFSKGETIDPEDIPEWDPMHPEILAPHVIRSRREVLQHALALYYIVQEMVVDNRMLSEQIILTTHRILVSNIDAPGGTSWKEYAGKYRHIHVHAGSTNFVTPNFVPAKMMEFIQQFNADTAEIEKTRVLDPFTLAAKYCNDFVMIHPFLDGNGRMCRLILNTILLKYAGVVVVIGEHDEGRAEYLAIQRRAGERMEGSGELATLILRKAVVRYRQFKKKLTGKKR